MRLLLDTQLFLWFVAGSSKLSRNARSQISAADEVFVSAASIWEASVKSSLGKLDVNPEDLVGAIAASGFEELPIRAAHAAAVAKLASIHKDPFDRILVAQAMEEPMRFLTADRLLESCSELVTIV